MGKYSHNRRKRQLVGINHPELSLNSVQVTALQLKEAVEMLQGQRGSAYDCAVTWGDLLVLGLIKEDQIPHDVGADRLR